MATPDYPEPESIPLPLHPDSTLLPGMTTLQPPATQNGVRRRTNSIVLGPGPDVGDRLISNGKKIRDAIVIGIDIAEFNRDLLVYTIFTFVFQNTARMTRRELTEFFDGYLVGKREDADTVRKYLSLAPLERIAHVCDDPPQEQ